MAADILRPWWVSDKLGQLKYAAIQQSCGVKIQSKVPWPSLNQAGGSKICRLDALLLSGPGGGVEIFTGHSAGMAGGPSEIWQSADTRRRPAVVSTGRAT